VPIWHIKFIYLSPIFFFRTGNFESRVPSFQMAEGNASNVTIKNKASKRS
jgi:hypothetical protein